MDYIGQEYYNGPVSGGYSTGRLEDYRRIFSPGHPYYPMRRRVVFFVTDPDDAECGAIYVDGHKLTTSHEARSAKVEEREDGILVTLFDILEKEVLSFLLPVPNEKWSLTQEDIDAATAAG